MDYKEKLKTIINSNKTPFVDIDTFLKYFPELKESEDEKIRKDLIVYLRSILSNKKYGDKFIEGWIAWLEKQGENFYNKELSELLHKVICRFINDPDIPYSERDEVSKKIIPYIEQLEKQGEQQGVSIQINPSEYINDVVGNGCYLKNTTQASAWSEEDEYYHNIILYILNNEYVGKADKENTIDWLKSIKDRVQH